MVATSASYSWMKVVQRVRSNAGGGVAGLSVV